MKSVQHVPQLLTIKLLREMYLNYELTPEEVVIEIIHRVKQDEDMNIWITPPTMDRIQSYLDRLASMDRNSFPLWGIPFAIKDNIDLSGVPTTAACPQYAYIPKISATVVERLIAAGAIPLGKTNLDQFATGLVGTRSPYGETKNALKEELISGGSSSGSAVAVARGHAAFALGTDTAGSGRVPAALNRLVGFKPSKGAWPTTGVVPACASLDCVTVFTHNLQDALDVDQIVRGEDETDPWSRSFSNILPKRPTRIYLPKQPLSFFGPFRDEYRNAWVKTMKRLEGLCLPIEYIDYDLLSEAASILYEGPWVAERWADLGDFVKANKEDVHPVTEKVLSSGVSHGYSAASAFQAIHKIQSIKHEVKKILKDSVLILPTCGGTWMREQVRLNPIHTNNKMGKYTNHCNLLDLSAIAIPTEDVEPNIPFGITMFSLAEQEGLIFGLASQFLGEISTETFQPQKNSIFIAVCGLHMRGFSLENEMHQFGAKFVYETSTAPEYRLYKLPTDPVKPGLIKTNHNGASIRLEVWEMPLASFGAFTASITEPLSIGTVELINGNKVSGFLCEAYIANQSEDITDLGGWRSYCLKKLNS